MTTLTLETEPLAAQVHVTHEKLTVDLEPIRKPLLSGM